MSSQWVQNTPFNFGQQRVLIFGAAKGIGRASALEFARRGARVVLADVDEANAQGAATEIIDAGGQALGIRCDVSNETDMAAAVTRAEEYLGAIDVVMNNVGIIMAGNPEDVPTSEWQRVMDLNFFPVVRSNELLLKKMITRGSGYIVNTASFAGLYPYAASRLPYAAAKAAVISLSESLAMHVIPRDLRVSYFCPGPVMTGVSQGIKSWSEDAVMNGPGSQFGLLTAEAAAVILADGMEAGRIFIPTHEDVVDLMQQRAASPDQFIYQKIDELQSGDYGLPVFPR